MFRVRRVVILKSLQTWAQLCILMVVFGLMMTKDMESIWIVAIHVVRFRLILQLVGVYQLHLQRIMAVQIQHAFVSHNARVFKDCAQ
ncbi:hypothetical protein COZ14_00400 [Candidatus Dojkabacteria bacterium CG_4_10_14_3_um_filter_Dojkabacteria_WS6_41_9]|nr:MAG: hypothetical protein COZ14_00400 [Candidatus Dojkabacteria bacterium CG_4_10_14_3_um_filter_Dojkabacteria_WS6_41_9]